MDWQVFVIPCDSFIVFMQRLSLAPFFFYHYYTCSLLCALFVCPYMPCILLSLLFWVGSLPTPVQQKAFAFWQLWSKKGNSVVLEWVYTCVEAKYLVSRGGKKASPTAAFLNASRQICRYAAFLCPLL